MSDNDRGGREVVPIKRRETGGAASAERNAATKATKIMKGAVGAAASHMSAAGAAIANRTDQVIAQAGALSIRASATASAVASGIARSVGDLNGDGKLDDEDLRIAREAVKKAAGAVGAEAAELGKAVLRHEMTKDAAAGAAIGALVAVPIPLVGPAVGAAVGAAFSVTRGVLGKAADATLAGQALSGGVRMAQGLAGNGRTATTKKRPAKKRRAKAAKGIG